MLLLKQLYVDDLNLSIEIDSYLDMSTRNWVRCDVVIDECSLDECSST